MTDCNVPNCDCPYCQTVSDKTVVSLERWPGYRIFVDDMRPVPEGWIGCRTVSEAIQTLATLQPIAEVSLDHDILFPATRVDRYTPLLNETFKGVAYFIRHFWPQGYGHDMYPFRLRIHTSNAGAARTMADILGVDFNKAYKKFNAKDYESAGVL